MNRRFDDLIKTWEQGLRYDFMSKIKDYNLRTSKWDFFEYLKLSVDSEGVSKDTALEILFYAIDEMI